MKMEEGGAKEGDEDSVRELDVFIKTWEKDFEKMNENPEENSDFDSDNEVNPIDTINTNGRYVQSQSKMTELVSSENLMKKRPIQLSIVGRPNVGKSTLVNGLLKESRVIANDLAGTTRDSVMVSWIYKGRRINLVDTAGIKPGTAIKSKLEAKVNE
jgi:GTP-binding protein